MRALASRSAACARPRVAPAGRRPCVSVRAAKQLKDRTTVKGGAAEPAPDEDVGVLGTAAITAGLPANAIALWSEWTLFQTGAGLPPGPAGLLGAAEGISYLVVLGLIGWSIATKVSTGSGLPAGPAGLLGAAEGVSYLTLLAGIVAFGAKFVS